MSKDEKDLWKFQETGIEFLSERKRAILADEMGIGKTRQGIGTAYNILPAGDCDHLLILGSKKAMYVWQRELARWWPELGDQMQYTDKMSAMGRRIMYQTQGAKYIMTTTAALLRDKEYIPYNWDMIILDEPHRYLRNRNTKIFALLKRLKTNGLLFMTGTPVSRGPQDLWPMLHLIDRKQFSSFWRFVNTFTFVTDGHFGKQIEGVRNASTLKELLSRYMIRRLKAEVFPEMPPKIVDRIEIDMDPIQAAFHEQFLEEMLASLEGSLIISQNTITAMLKLRQMLACPKILNPRASYGAGIEYLREVILDLPDDDRHLAIFTPFRPAVQFIRQALWERKIRSNYLWGSMTVAEMEYQMDEYNNDKTVMVCTISSAEAYSLASSSNAYFLGAEHDPILNIQAEDRMHRAETVETVNINYVTHRNSVETDVMDNLTDKYGTTSKFMSDPRALQKLLRKHLNMSK